MRGTSTTHDADTMLEALLTRWEDFLAQTERLYRRLGEVPRPPHGRSVFETAAVQWDPIELTRWLNLVPMRWAKVERRAGARVRVNDGVWLGYVPITLEAADGPLIEAVDHIRFELRLFWRHDPLGWSLIGVDPDHDEAERARRVQAHVKETDPFLAVIRGHLDASGASEARAVLAEVRDSTRTTNPALLAVLMQNKTQGGSEGT